LFMKATVKPRQLLVVSRPPICRLLSSPSLVIRLLSSPSLLPSHDSAPREDAVEEVVGGSTTSRLKTVERMRVEAMKMRERHNNNIEGEMR